MNETTAQLCIQPYCLGDWQTNCYVVHQMANHGDESLSPKSTPVRTPCWIVDAGFDPDDLIAYVRDNNIEPQAVLMTHAHVDHIAGLHAVREAFPDVPILIHADEAEFLTDTMLNLSAMTPYPTVAPEATDTLVHGQVLELADFTCEVRHTPGHSPGGVAFCFLDKKIAIVGDTLFAGSVGRTDFPTSNHDAMFNSIREQLLTLPDDTQVLPGHGPVTTVGRERETNPFLI